MAKFSGISLISFLLLTGSYFAVAQVNAVEFGEQGSVQKIQVELLSNQEFQCLLPSKWGGTCQIHSPKCRERIASNGSRFGIQPAAPCQYRFVQ